MLYKFRRERLLPEFPIYIGGLSSKMTDIYDRRAHMTRRQLPRLQLMREAAPFILNDETVRDAPAARGTGLRALQWDDDTENTLQCSCASINREPAALDLFCRLCQPGIACRSSTGRENRWGGCARSRQAGPARPLQYRTVSVQRACHARGAHRLRRKTFARAKLFLCTAIHRRWSGCARTLSATFPDRKLLCRRRA